MMTHEDTSVDLDIFQTWSSTGLSGLSVADPIGG